MPESFLIVYKIIFKIRIEIKSPIPNSSSSKYAGGQEGYYPCAFICRSGYIEKLGFALHLWI